MTTALSKMSRSELIQFYKEESEKIIASSQDPELLRPIANRFLLRLENTNGSTRAMVKASKEMWEAFHELNQKLKEFCK